MLQLLIHALGDYVFQSDWMAQRKTKESFPALVHATLYTLGFVWIPWVLIQLCHWTGKPVPMEQPSLAALLVIGVTHFLIDRFRLARYVCWIKNFIAPPTTYALEANANHDIIITWWCRPWKECSGTGYPKERDAWMAVWLLIITDNIIHLGINWLALYFL